MEAARQRCILFAPAEHAPASSPPIFGLHLVERTVLAFLRAGVREFIVVGDPEGARWIAEKLASRRFRGARVRVLEPQSSLLPVLEREIERASWPEAEETVRRIREGAGASEAGR